jgi:hypothetical protein
MVLQKNIWLYSTHLGHVPEMQCPDVERPVPKVPAAARVRRDEGGERAARREREVAVLGHRRLQDALRAHIRVS